MDELHNSHNRPEIPRHLPPSDAPPPADTPPIIIGADYDGDAPAPTTPPSERYIDTNFNYETRQGAADTQPPAALGELSIKGAAETAAGSKDNENGAEADAEKPIQAPNPDIEEPRHEQPGAADGGDIPPIDTPPAGTAEPEPPDRGAALQELFDYSTVSDQRINDSIAKETGLSPEAPEAIFNSKLEQRHADAELANAKREYSRAIEATGLDMEIDLNGIELRVTDPHAFAAALEQTPTPEPGVVETRYTNIIDKTLYDAAKTVIPESPEAIIDPASNNTADFTAQLSEQAGTIAQQLDRLGAPQNVVDPMKQLAAANEKKMVHEWISGYRLQVIGHSDALIGVNRLVHPSDWEPVYHFLSDLRYSAPDAHFTKEVGRIILRDIEAAINGPDPTLIPSSGDTHYEAETPALRDHAQETAKSYLEAAQQRILRILGGSSEEGTTGTPTKIAEPDFLYRGKALQRLCDYEAIPSDELDAADRALAAIQYGQYLADAGLQFTGAGETSLLITDLHAFGKALAQVPIPTDARARERLQRQATSLVKTAITSAIDAMLLFDPQEATDALGGVVPPTADFEIIADVNVPSAPPKQNAFALKLSTLASTFSWGLSRLGVSKIAVDEVRQLNYARHENLLTEYAVGSRLKLIGNSASPIGVERLSTADDWEPIHRFLKHLANKAPAASLTRAVRKVILDDIDRTLNEPDSVEAPPTGDPLQDAENYVRRLALRENSLPVLEEARARILLAMPWDI